MAIFDAELMFSDKQAITATAPSDNVVDFLVEMDIGAGEPLWVYAIASEAFAGGTGLAVEVEVSADEAFTAPVTIATGQEVPVADLTQGADVFRVRLPVANDSYRYMRLNFAANGAFTAGAISAGITCGVNAWRTYPKGYEHAGDTD